MPEPTPVTLRSGASWGCGLHPLKLFAVIDSFEAVSKRVIKEGAVQRLRLDTESRRADGNLLETPQNTKHRARVEWRFNKGLAMEVAVASAMTLLDHFDQVQSFWSVKGPKNRPNRHAPSGKPDMIVRPGEKAPTFQVICEVSSGRTMNRKYLRQQLKSALKHCVKHHEREAVDITYGLLVNGGKIGTSRVLQATYREFVTDEENGLTDVHGPIRLVVLQTSDFGSALRRLYAEGQLGFPGNRLAHALDELHVRLRTKAPDQVQVPGEKAPKKKAARKRRTKKKNARETRPQWMVDLFVETVTGSAQMHLDLADPEAGARGSG